MIIGVIIVVIIFINTTIISINPPIINSLWGFKVFPDSKQRSRNSGLIEILGNGGGDTDCVGLTIASLGVKTLARSDLQMLLTTGVALGGRERADMIYLECLHSFLLF